MKIKSIVIFFLILALSSCNGQDKGSTSKQIKDKKIAEKFDFDIYRKTNYGSNSVTKEDGVIISMIDFDNQKGGVLKEIMPLQSFETIYKEYYANGNIKKREIYIGEKTKMDTSEYYDENGNVEKVDENKKFGKIKPEDVLKFLEQKKIINISTGKGRFDEDQRPTFEIQFDEKIKEYFITIFNGRPNTPENFPKIGEPSAYIPVIYKMDGETGKVVEVEVQYE